MFFWLFVKNQDLHLLREDKFIDRNKNFNVKARIRYRQPLQNALLIFVNEGAYLVFKTKQSSITKGQFAVWYNNKELLGSGVIS